MSLLLARGSQLLRGQGSQKLPQLLKQNAEKAISCCTIQVANLTSTNGEKVERFRPWPYKTRGFRYWYNLVDRTDWRLDDNSKIIVIDGNIATGKSDLGKKIAKEFDMLYIPDVTDEDMYRRKVKDAFDIREYDEQLPMKARTCDFETFYSQKGPQAVLNNFPRTQYELFQYKMFKYAEDIMAHVLSTGQGVVINRGMYSDLVFAHALNKTHYFSNKALKAYQKQWRHAVNSFWHPHLVIYLDAPIELVRENINKRNKEWEKNSPVLTDEYLQSIDDAYQNFYLPYMKQRCEMLTYDLSDNPVPEFDLVVEELEELDLETVPVDYPMRFFDWNNNSNYHYNDMRNLCSVGKEIRRTNILSFWPPYECPELMLEGMDLMAYKDIVEGDPRFYYDKKFQPGNPMTYLKPGLVNVLG